ncbi:FecR domain-containing protein [uncultured Bacteroides sp.]|uniref:FecR family protein n=1 Tax=uncultured Bacteroides sp. TaxID=162156 RepID=UPI002AAB95A2|nr:FecR domain-containing protein [uncultured Bacteroides sp.]
MNEIIIYKYLIGQTTQEEEKELFEWLEASSENKRLFFEIETIWKTRSDISDKNQSLEVYKSLVKMNEIIDRSEAEKHGKKYLKRKNLVYWWGGIAASILVAVLFLTHYATSNAPLLYTYTNLLPDSVKQVKLKDGSVVWLSQNATIAYSDGYTGDERHVKLKGLAFFDVEKDPKHPFIVETETFRVKVLGTAFSVNSDNPSHKGEVVLLRGSVQLEDRSGENLTKIHPGQQVLYSRELNSLDINEIDAKSYTSWRYNLMSLPNATLSEIISSLEQTYKVKIQMDFEDLKYHKYNFYYKGKDNLDDVLEQIYYLTGKRAKIIH